MRDVLKAEQVRDRAEDRRFAVGSLSDENQKCFKAVITDHEEIASKLLQ